MMAESDNTAEATRRLNVKKQTLDDAYAIPANFLEIDVVNPLTSMTAGKKRYTDYEVRMRVVGPEYREGLMANTSNPGIERLVGRENWTTWKFAVQTYLEVEDLWEAVEPKKKADGTLEAIDPVKDRKARGRIILFLEPENYYHVREAATAREVWKKLCDAFEETGLTREVGLLYKLIRTDLEGCGTMENYANRMLSTCHQLNEIGSPIPDRFVGVLLLAGLPERYQPMVMALKNSGTPITGDSIKTILLQEETVPGPGEKIALVAKGRNNEKFSGNQGNNQAKPKKHFQAKGPKCRKCSKFGHIAKFCPENQANRKADAFCTVLSTFNSMDQDDWYLDSGATRHMTKSLELLEDVKDVRGTVVAANKGSEW